VQPGLITKGGLLACLLLSLAIASASDGGDMNWTIHVIGATGFFIVVFYVFIHISITVKTIWSVKPHFIS